MTEEILQFDDTALSLFHHLRLLNEDSHAWFKDDHSAPQIHGENKFVRLQDIALERTRVGMHLSEHITYVLLSDTFYRRGVTGIILKDALHIKRLITHINQGRAFHEEDNDLHYLLSTLKLVPDEERKTPS